MATASASVNRFTAAPQPSSMTPGNPPRRLRVKQVETAPARVQTQEMPKLWLYGHMGPSRSAAWRRERLDGAALKHARAGKDPWSQAAPIKASTLGMDA